jgi:hypothetical protein
MTTIHLIKLKISNCYLVKGKKTYRAIRVVRAKGLSSSNT